MGYPSISLPTLSNFILITTSSVVKTKKARASIWFLIVIPPLGILFFFVERYFIAANRQVSQLWKNRTFCWTIFSCIFCCTFYPTRSRERSREQCEMQNRGRTQILKISFCLLSEPKLTIGSATYIRLVFIQPFHLV